MKAVRWIFIITLLAAFPAHLSASRELLDQVIAVVNDEPITQSELDLLLKPVYDQFRQEYHGEDLIVKLNEARRKLLNQLIEDRLVHQEAVAKGMEVDYPEIDEKMEQFQAQFPNELAMEEVLDAQGMTLKDVRDRLTRQSLIRKLHDREIRAKIVVSPMEIEKYYSENEAKFAEEERIKVRSITLKKNYDAREKGLKDEDAYTRVTELRKKILTGQDFAKLAKESSEDVQAESGGLSDWIRRGAMIPVINDAIFSLDIGQASEIIETPMGYHIFRVEEKETASKQSLEEVRDQIHQELYTKKTEDRFYEWMQELKREAYISIR